MNISFVLDQFIIIFACDKTIVNRIVDEEFILLNIHDFPNSKNKFQKQLKDTQIDFSLNQPKICQQSMSLYLFHLKLKLNYTRKYVGVFHSIYFFLSVYHSIFCCSSI